MLRKSMQTAFVRGVALAALGFVMIVFRAQICFGPVVPREAIPPGTQAQQMQAKGEFEGITGPGKLTLVLNGQKWLLLYDQSSEIKVTGTGSTAALQKGMCIRFKGTFKGTPKNLNGTEDIKDVEVFSPDANNQPAALAAGSGFDEGKKPAAGPTSYSIAGKIINVQKNKFTLDCSPGKVKVEISPDATVKLEASDPSYAASGDKVSAQVYFGRAGFGYLLKAEITKSNPMPEPKKKPMKGAKATDKPVSAKKGAMKPDDTKPETAAADVPKPDAAKPDATKPFTSKEGRFTVQFPAEPQVKDQDVESGIGKMTVHSFNAKVGSVEYVVVYADIPAAVTPEQLKQIQSDAGLDGVRDGIAKTTKTHLGKETKITVGKWPGREFVLEATNEGPVELTGRVFYANARQYQLLVGGPKGQKPADDKIQAFFDSFKMTTE